MELTITVKCDELVAAINRICDVLTSTNKNDNAVATTSQSSFTAPAQEKATTHIIPTEPVQYYNVPVATQTNVSTQVPAYTNNVTPVTQPATLPSQQVPAPMPVPVTTATPQSYTQQQIALAATKLVDANKIDVLMQILNSFGANTIMEVPTEQYGALAAKLREQGVEVQ